MGSSKPIGLILGLPFALMAAFISIIAATIFVFGSARTLCFFVFDLRSSASSIGSCKPIGLTLRIPFALMEAFISIIAAAIFVFGSVCSLCLFVFDHRSFASSIGSCKPISLMLGLPLALMAAFISIIAAAIFVFGRLLHKGSPCFKNCDQVADKACGLTDLPIKAHAHSVRVRVQVWTMEAPPPPHAPRAPPPPPPPPPRPRIRSLVEFLDEDDFPWPPKEYEEKEQEDVQQEDVNRQQEDVDRQQENVGWLNNIKKAWGELFKRRPPPEGAPPAEKAQPEGGPPASGASN